MKLTGSEPKLALGAMVILVVVLVVIIFVPLDSTLPLPEYDDSYPPLGIPHLTCDSIRRQVTIPPEGDPYGFDGDGDGIGCNGRPRARIGEVDSLGRRIIPELTYSAP